MTPIEKFLLFVAAPAVLVFALVEALVLSRRSGYDWRAFGVRLTAQLEARLIVTPRISIAQRTNSDYLEKGS